MTIISNLESSSGNISQIATPSDAINRPRHLGIGHMDSNIELGSDTPDANAGSNCCLTGCFSGIVSLIAYIPNKILSFAIGIISYITNFCCKKSDLEMIQAFIDQQSPEESGEAFLQAFNALPQEAISCTIAQATFPIDWSKEVKSSSGEPIDPSSAASMSWMNHEILSDIQLRKLIIVWLQSYLVTKEFPELSNTTSDQDPLAAAQAFIAASPQDTPSMNTLPKILKNSSPHIEEAPQWEWISIRVSMMI